VEFNSFGPAVGRLGSDSSRGAKVEAGGLSPPSPLTLTTAYTSYTRPTVPLTQQAIQGSSSLALFAAIFADDYRVSTVNFSLPLHPHRVNGLAGINHIAFGGFHVIATIMNRNLPGKRTL